MNSIKQTRDEENLKTIFKNSKKKFLKGINKIFEDNPDYELIVEEYISQNYIPLITKESKYVNNMESKKEINNLLKQAREEFMGRVSTLNFRCKQILRV